ncbi:glycosyltransferase involved in cell wall biosynthesis [Anaerospora hongkongensis]|uniref:Glycosyltransferase involved in cell wall biosynthesis n=2 Tax=Anaerospora hongkongensis TaxID=244830 RepID=A0A4R1PWT3_9FIRM|nr:glycosyltransferase involved in cell wall biosynthesis [Anaerospora hongkongensis]
MYTLASIYKERTVGIMKISACMIAKNEEKVIARCIESYRAAVDEVIVVDTGSTDQTVAIAKSLGAKVFHFTWIDDFAAAKNYAISKAKGDWIVFLDADEYFVEGTGGKLRTCLEKLDKAFGAVACRMINIDEVNGKTISEIVHVRIFKKDKQLRYVNPIHEALHYRDKDGNINAYLADKGELLIHHTGYSATVNQVKARRNLELLLKQVDDNIAAKPEYYYYIADTYFTLDKWDKVITYIRLFIDTGAKLTNLNVRVYNILIDAMMELGYSLNEIMREVNIAITQFPQHPLFHFYKGKLLYDDKCYDAAFTELRQALQLHENYQDIEVNSLAVNLGTLYNLMAVISEFRNDAGTAIEYYLETLKLDKYDATAFDRLLKQIRSQPLQDIISFLNTLYDVEYEADLDFLATSLVNHAVPQVLAYYTSLREKKYPKQDYVVLQMLVANGHYDKAFAALLECYSRDGDERLALVSATAAMLSGNGAYMEKASEQLPSAYAKLLKAYRGDIILFAEEDKAAFLNLVRTFIFWAGDDAMQKMLNLIDQFPNGMGISVASLFVQEGYYQAGLQYYDYAVQRSVYAGIQVHSGLYFNQGYCLHRLNNPVAATEAFLKAYEAGYRVNDIYEFLRWNIGKLDADSLRVRVNEILQHSSEVEP